MAYGTVKWFNGVRGFGIIVAGEGGEEIFVHWSEVVSPTPPPAGASWLDEGQQVEFERVPGNPGPHARAVRPLG